MMGVGVRVGVGVGVGVEEEEARMEECEFCAEAGEWPLDYRGGGWGMWGRMGG
jgi:hypothetical protein